MTLSAERFRSDLLNLIDRFAAVSGMADSSISRFVFGSDKDFIKKIRAGENFTVDKAERLERWLRRGIVIAIEDRARLYTVAARVARFRQHFRASTSTPAAAAAK